jgi:ribonucleoside-diphosphate reductase alpha chain
MADYPDDTVAWEWADVEVRGESGDVLFSERCEFPRDWSPRSREIVASKYFYGCQEQGFRESSLRQLVGRVTATVVQWGIDQGYFASPDSARAFYRDLAWLQLHQHFAFNSPVYFNVGLHHYGVRADPEGYRHVPGMGDLTSGSVAECQDPIKHPQISACFIQSVRDDMSSIMDLAKSEAILFKRGSGTGTDLSTLRSSRERLTGGGRPSGPVSFMRVYDAVAAIVKSGGKKRRAAKMQSLQYWHPDIFEFVRAKRDQEQVVRVLKAAGYSADFNGGAYDNAHFQNCNTSVRVDGKFMDAARDRAEVPTVAVRTGEPMGSYRADVLFREIAECAHDCGDPGLQFDDAINAWNTVPGTGRINASNPCGEYNFADDSACNLASHNLIKYLRDDNQFDCQGLLAACEVAATAQDIMVDPASYPTEAIARNSHRLRPLGGGYANLGALLMSLGIPYDSDHGRALAASLTAILTGAYYLRSALVAGALGPFAEFAANREGMLRVIGMHRASLGGISRPAAQGDRGRMPLDVLGFARFIWDETYKYGQKFGYRNAQATCIAPTGTIAFMMDCDTLGAEPEIALLRAKKLAGGGLMILANECVPRALRSLGYSGDEIGRAVDRLKRYGTLDVVSFVNGQAIAPAIKEEHLCVFDCSFPAAMSSSGRCLRPEAHVLMVAACTPFVSGSISKTVNMPRDATVEGIMETYELAYRSGCKSITVYRDGSKEDQPVRAAAPAQPAAPGPSTDGRDEPARREDSADAGDGPGDWTTQASRDQMIEHIKNLENQIRGLEHHVRGVGNDFGLAPRRDRLPDTRRSVTHKFNVVGHEGYLTVGFYDDGRPGEMFVTMAKEGSTIAGLMDWIGTQTSLMLQYGVPLHAIVRKAAGMHFQPYGATTNRQDLPFVKSIIDYIYRWLGCELIPGYRDNQSPRRGDDETPARSHGPDSMQVETVGTEVARMFPVAKSTGNACPSCGSMTIRQGLCEQCFNCGYSDGGCGG